MGNNIIWIIVTILFVILAAYLATMWTVINQPEIPTCPKIDIPECPKVNIPACPQAPACNPPIVEKIVYKACFDDIGAAKEDAEIYEENTGKKVYSIKSTRTCDDFILKLPSNREVVSYANLKDGCQVYYVLK